MHAAYRVASPRRPATITQFADTSSPMSYASQNAAVSARSCVDRRDLYLGGAIEAGERRGHRRREQVGPGQRGRQLQGSHHAV